MNKQTKWTKVQGRFHYLSLLHRGDDVLGFIMQQGPESQFNCNVGKNEEFTFIGHKRNSIVAKNHVETAAANLGI